MVVYTPIYGVLYLEKQHGDVCMHSGRLGGRGALQKGKREKLREHSSIGI